MGLRMNNIPADLRGSLADYLWNVPPENAKAFVDLLRKTMTLDQYVSILRNNRLTEYNFSPGSSGDPAKIQKNLDSLGLTSEERSTLLTQHFEELAKYRHYRPDRLASTREEPRPELVSTNCGVVLVCRWALHGADQDHFPCREPACGCAGITCANGLPAACRPRRGSAQQSL